MLEPKRQNSIPPGRNTRHNSAIPRKVHHRVADHHVCKPAGEQHLLDLPHLEVFVRQSRRQRGSELAHMLNGGRIGVKREHLAPFAEKMHQVSPVTASRVKHTHSRRDVPAQNLVEHINIDLTELFLDRQRHLSILVKHI